MAPVPHAFHYRLFMMYLDLAELPDLFRGRWFWSARRAALARFRREDHLGDPTVSLEQAVRDLVEERTGRRPGGPPGNGNVLLIAAQRLNLEACALGYTHTHHRTKTYPKGSP